MKSTNRKETTNFYQIISNDEPIAVMSFKPSLIGVFTNYGDLDKALKQSRISVVYTTTNVVKRNVLKKLPLNKFEVMNSDNSISAKDIKELRYFFVDIDVVGLRQGQDKKRNATDEEHEEARKVAEHVQKFLANKDFPAPIFIDSGNGFHLLYPIKLTATKENEILIKNSLIALSEEVNTEVARIDTGIFDRSRKIKMPGSVNNKEDDFFRISKILTVPEEKGVVSEEQLRELAKLAKNKNGGWKNSQSDNLNTEEEGLAEIAENAGRYYMADNGQFFADVMVDNKRVTYNLKSDEFRYYMRRLMKSALKIKMIRSSDWRELMDYLEVLASEKKESVSIYNRVGKKDRDIFYDLQTANYKSVCITKGDYDIRDTPAGIFQRADLDLPQVSPIYDENYDFWEKMEELFNFRSQEELELFVLWLISTYIPDIAHPILLLTGPHGSSKSTASSMIQSLVSPQKMERSTFPRKVSDLAIRLANRCICVFDNCSKLSLEASDALCSCATGGNYEKRKLYTDSQMISIPLKSSVVLNSCETLIERPDLLSRTLQFNLQTLTGKKLRSDDDMRRRFEKEKPYLLGYIFACIATYLADEEEVDESEINYVIRMTEFQRVVMKIGRSCFDMTNEYVENLLLMNKKMINIQVLETNPVSLLIINFMKDKDEWKGSVSKLYDKLDLLAFELGIEKGNKLYPRHAASLSMRLNSLASMLEQAGITFHIKPSGTYKEILLKNQNAPSKTKKQQSKVEEEDIDIEDEFDVEE